MKLQVFSVYDKAVGLFMAPIFLRSDAEAVRALRNALKGEHMFSQSPQDYVLYHLTEFDETSGGFVPRDTPPRVVVELSALKEE